VQDFLVANGTGAQPKKKILAAQKTG